MNVKSFSAFDNPGEYAGLTPFVPYLKGLFADFTGAHRIYIDREIGSLPCLAASLDHTFDVGSLYCLFVSSLLIRLFSLQFHKYAGGLKGQPIFTTAYTV